jgi:TolB protein
MSRRGVVVAVLALAVVVPAAHATPPGTNGMVIWQRESRDTPPDLWVANPDGTGARAVFATPRIEGEGTISPTDPNRVAFVRGGRRGLPFEVHVGDLATGRVQRFTRFGAYTDAPAWSPDGTRIAFHTDRDFPPPEGEEDPPPPPEIYVMRADGSGQRRLTRDRRQSIDPDFSPDGRHLVYTEGRVRRGRQELRIVRIRADGRAKRALTRFSRRLTINPKWMPDGQRIVFEVERRGTRSDIAVMNADGSGRRILLATPAWETNPVPSPDGTRIVFTSDRDRPDRRERLSTGTEVYTMAVDGTDVVRLTTNRELDIFPDWQRVP